MWKKVLIFLIFYCVTSSVYSLTEAPIPIRACLNNNNSVVSLEWRIGADACGSFQQYIIQARETAGDPWTNFGTLNNLNPTSYNFNLPNLNNSWRFRILALYACNGTDTLKSIDFGLDLTKPNPNAIDSVTVDLATQKLLVGWKENSSPDVKGYRIYTYSGSINDSLGTSFTTDYLVPNLDPTQKVQITLAAFDSCNLYSSISDPHSAVVLSTNFDTCSRNLNLSWTSYAGWGGVNKYELFSAPFGTNNYTLKTSHDPGAAGSSDNIVLGDSICYYVRAFHPTDATVTSTSNVSCVFTRKLDTVGYVYIDKVSVLDGDIEASIRVDENIDTDQLILERSSANEGWKEIWSTPLDGSQNYYTTDRSAKVNTTVYTYRSRTLNKCEEVNGESQTAQNIVLAVNEFIGDFNPYINWDGMVDHYEIERSPDEGSTWNFINQTPITTFEDQNAAEITANQICYRVAAYEGTNRFGEAAFSYSNKACNTMPLTVWIPDAFIPENGDDNNRFIILGQGIDYEKSYYEIYNRWGEIIIKNPANIEWRGYKNGRPIPPGVYLYRVEVFGLQGERKSEHGTIRIIR